MRLDRYILREWLKVFLLVVAVVFGVLLLGDVQDKLQDLLAMGVSRQDIVAYHFFLLPTLFPVAIPVSFMISLLFCLGQFHRNQEITAMRAAGFSLFRITRGLWACGLLLTMGLFQANATLIPRAVEQTREMWGRFTYQRDLAQAGSEADVGGHPALTFYNRRDGRLWFMNRFNEYTYRASGITVSVMDPGEVLERRRVVANEGYFDEFRRQWTFLQGREIWFEADTGQPYRSLPFAQKVFAEFKEDPELMRVLEKVPADLSRFELERAIEYLRPQDDPRLNRYAVAYYDRILNPLSCLVILGLAIPFSVRGVRTNPFVGVSKAVGWFVLYLVLVSVGQLAGRSGFDPLLAASLPNVAALALVAYYFLQLRRPS
jgi:lipopolysaccharide export system permease protein